MDERTKKRLRGYLPGTVHVVLAFLGAYGACYVFGLAGFQRAPYTVFSVGIMGVVWQLLHWMKKDLAVLRDVKLRRKRIVFSTVLAYLFSLAMVMGYQLQKNGMTDGGFKGKGMILARAACLALAVVPAANLFFKLVERIPRLGEAGGMRGVPGGISGKAVFGASAAATFLCLVPVWLAYYPIIMSYDFHRQVNEAAKGFVWFYPYQPIAHTWIIWLFLQVGEALGSQQAGMACMALSQMLLYSLVTGYAAAMVYRIVKRLWAAVCAFLFFAVFPYNTVLVMCTTKDVLFTVLFLLFFLLFLERTYFCAGRKKWIVDALMVLEGCLMVQFRNNAIYALAVFLVVFLLAFPKNKRERLEVLLLCVLLLAGGRTLQFVILKAIGTQLEAPKVEMYSVPIQQFARVARQHGEELDEETALLLESYMDRQVWNSYYPPIADSVKNSGKVNEAKFTEDTGQFLRDWIALGLKYPNEFIDAFLELTRGYWFWDDVSWAENLGYGVEERFGVVFTYTSSEIEGAGSIEHETKFAWLEGVLEQVVSGNCFYHWPVISLIFKGAFYTWLLFLVMVVYGYLGQWDRFLVGLFPALYFGTMLLGPVVQIRYLFPLMSVLPLMVAMAFWNRRVA